MITDPAVGSAVHAPGPSPSRIRPGAIVRAGRGVPRPSRILRGRNPDGPSRSCYNRPAPEPSIDPESPRSGPCSPRARGRSRDACSTSRPATRTPRGSSGSATSSGSSGWPGPGSGPARRSARGRRGGRRPQRLRQLLRGTAEGRFPDLADRDDLWRLLVVITARKAAAQARWQARQKRGGGRVVDEADLRAGSPRRSASSTGSSAASRPPSSPRWWPRSTGACSRPSATTRLRQVAIRRMEGYTTDEIADQLGCARRTVARRLDLIRKIWADGRETARRLTVGHPPGTVRLEVIPTVEGGTMDDRPAISIPSRSR